MIYLYIMKKFFAFIFLIIYFLSLGCTSFANNSLENAITEEKPKPDISSLNIYSDCILLIEKETGDILYEKNAYEKMYPASTTKTLTAILVLENCDLDEVATVSSVALRAVPPSYTTANLQIR